ncbi:MAG: hypothetical protein JWQ98_2673 [Chlorobi bacterium]|nr:hypothetical protein [Chlorobiota bacterium]
MEPKKTREDEDQQRLNIPSQPPAGSIQRDDDEEDDLLPKEKLSNPLGSGCQSLLGCATGVLILIFLGIAAGSGYVGWPFLITSALTGGMLLLHFKMRWHYFAVGILIMFGIFGLICGYCAFGFR